MENFRPINFHQVRDFSSKVNATFEFLRQNWQNLFKAVLIIAGPPVLIGSIALGSTMADMFSFSPQDTALIAERFSSITFWLQFLVMMLFLTLSGVMMLSTVNNYLVLYEEKQSNKIEVHEIWERVRDSFWMYLGTMALLVTVFMMLYILMVMLAAFVAQASQAFAILLGIVFVWAMFYFIVACSFIFIIRTYEKVGFINSLTRSFRLIYGKWWSTFGLMFVLTLILIFAGYAILIPYSVVKEFGSMHDTSSVSSDPDSEILTVSTIVFAVYYLVQITLYSIPTIGLAFQYFNLVERKEARGLMNQIDAIGSAPARSTEEQY